jgi:lysine 6-dehydrogenase
MRTPSSATDHSELDLEAPVLHDVDPSAREPFGCRRVRNTGLHPHRARTLREDVLDVLFDVFRPAKYVHEIDVAGDVHQPAIDRLTEDVRDLGIVDRNGNDLEAGALRVVGHEECGPVAARFGLDAQHGDAMDTFEQRAQLVWRIEEMGAPVMGGLRLVQRTLRVRLAFALTQVHRFAESRCMRMLVLGAGLQGSACAYDLLQNPDVSVVRLADLNIGHLPRFLAPLSGPRLFPTRLDVRDQEAVLAVMRESDAVMSAIPYYFNLELARLAVEAGTHFCDLGGNTEIVFQQKELEPNAKRAGVTIVPDCGLAPGMVNILAQSGISQLDSVESVKIFVGGLPQQPKPPLNYQIVYSLEGVLDYYTTLSWVVRDGKRHQVTALSEIEPVAFPTPVGELEAFHTAGGLSTMAFRYEGKIPTMEYKTLRYPGHAYLMAAMRDMGFFDADPISVAGVPVVPRDVAVAVMTPRLQKPDAPDLVALRVIVRGTKDGKAAEKRWELLDYFDEATGISAMMRTTGYSLSITGQMQARGEITPPGVHTPDECVPPGRYIEELAKRGVNIRG